MRARARARAVTSTGVSVEGAISIQLTLGSAYRSEKGVRQIKLGLARGSSIITVQLEVRYTVRVRVRNRGNR